MDTRKIEMLFRSKEPALWKVAQRACHTLRIKYWIVVVSSTKRRQQGSSYLRKKKGKGVVLMSTHRIVLNRNSVQLYHPYLKVDVYGAKVYRINLCSKT